MTGQENVTFWYRWLLNRGDRMGRYDYVYCIWPIGSVVVL